jgi:DNA-binding CsgD family transcriptional regulator/tetratricopeptide (TPR) repeat protein
MSDLSHLSQSLSNRELEVATAYAEGQSYKEIARFLSISPTTVRSHLRTIYSKLGVTSKIELVQHLNNTAEPRQAENRDDAALIAELALELDEAIRRERVLANVLRIISHQGDRLDDVIDEVLDHALEICEAEFGILFEYHGDLRYRAMRSRNISPVFEDWLAEQAIFSVDRETGLGRVALTSKTVNITDVRGEDIYRDQAPLRIATADLGNARSFAAIPMMSGDRLIGAFTVYRTRVHPFNDRSLELAQLFADQAAIAIENARSRAQHDGENTLSIPASAASNFAFQGPDKHPPRLLAILPFQAADESDGDLVKTGRRLASSITMELASSPLFRLVDQASSFSDTLNGFTPTDAAETLGADLIATATIRRVSPDGVRVAVWLHQVDRPAPVWTERFDSHGADTGSLLEDMLSRLCAAIGTSVERQMVSVAQTRRSRNQTAMDHFLQGLELHHRHGTDDFLGSRSNFEAALEKDPEFGRAAAALAITYVREWFWESMRGELLDVAEQQARIAIGMAPHDAWAQTVWGVVALYRHRHADAELSFKRAVELAPYDIYVVSRCGLGKLYNGDFDEAENLFLRSIELDPLHADRQRGLLGLTLFYVGRYDEAIELLEAIDQPLSWEIAWLAACYAEKGQLADARKNAERFRQSFESSGHGYPVRTRPFRRKQDMQRLYDALQSAGFSDDLLADG